MALDRRRVDLPGGGVLVLEVDGAFHMDLEHWGADLKRQLDDLRALGVPEM